MAAWKSFQAWPMWLRVPALAVVGVLALSLGFVLADSLFPASDDAPVSMVESTTTLETSTSTSTTTSTTVLPSTTTTVRSTTTTRLVVRLTNPIDIWYACDIEAAQTIGRRLTGSESGEAAALYQERERLAQQPGATVLAPSLEAWCRTWIRERFPNEWRNPNTPDYSKVLDGLINGGGSIPPGGVCHHTTAAGRHEYQAPSVSGSCPFGWELIR